ncbi:MAG: acetyl-CoA carboxylase biotin carboxylase subunit [Thermoproteota archaeon]|nr:acetyl-CoA carboxylase biotin carboxylase subunit [Thermoproteota archaeon]
MGKKISSILIANRGEIALRVVRACREMAIKSIAVYSDEDIKSIHVRKADEAFHIGAPLPSQSYLNMDKIMEVAKTAGADAVHPGYGFLSENESFAKRCEKEGIVFIGPKSPAMALTGDKMKCKEIMKKAGVPTVPGSDGIIEDVDEAVDIAREAGYPVLLKSAFGGGGRGIRFADDETKLREEFEIASAESQAAFGKSGLYVEKFLQGIRHIEFQLVRDSKGNTRHLFERECSIQRRHQKLIEISPSPVLDKEMRSEMGKVAMRAAEAVDYLNAGTAEFLRDSEGNFYFIEINSRLQVEHPVTEMVTGIDLVKLQINISRGEEIPFTQSELEIRGAAIECRVNAEDPFQEFAPSVGFVPNCNLPYGPGVRVDTYLYPGCTVSGYYDSLVAKLITWGQNFNEARFRMLSAIDEFIIEGINTTLALYRTILREKNFINGDISTEYLERFGLISKMEEEFKEHTTKIVESSLAAAVVYSEFLKKSIESQTGPNISQPQSRWIRIGRME